MGLRGVVRRGGPCAGGRAAGGLEAGGLEAALGGWHDRLSARGRVMLNGAVELEA